MPSKKSYEGYSVEALHRGIRSCEVNIVTFEDAIKRERQQMTEYRWMIDQINRKKKQKEEAEKVQIQVDAQIKAHNDLLKADAKKEGKRVVEVVKDGDKK